MRALKFYSAVMKFFAYTLYFLQLYNKPKKAAFARRLNDPFLQASIFQLLQDPGDERQLISMCLLTDDPSQVL